MPQHICLAILKQEYDHLHVSFFQASWAAKSQLYIGAYTSQRDDSASPQEDIHRRGEKNNELADWSSHELRVDIVRERP